MSITPCRLFDTRPATRVGDRSTPLNAGEEFVRQVTGTNGQCIIPSTATGISYNLTVPTSINGFLTLYPADATRPGSSSINPVAGEQVKANGGIVGLSATGAIKVFTLTGPVDALLDITGYFLPASAGPQGPPGPPGAAGSTGISTGHIDGATGNPTADFAKVGSWTSTRTGTGQYQITIPGLLTPDGAGGCAITKPLPNPVVSVWTTRILTTATAYISAVGSTACPPGDWSFYVQVIVNGALADSDFTFEFVTP